MSTTTVPTVIDNGTNDETARIYKAFKKLKNGHKGTRGMGRKAATEHVAHIYKKPIAEVREAILREQATAEGISYEDKLASFEKSREFSVVNHQHVELGGMTCFTDELTNTMITLSFSTWMDHLERRSRDWRCACEAETVMLHPITGQEVEVGHLPMSRHWAWYDIYQKALREAFLEAANCAIRNRVKLSNKLVQEAINDHPMSKDYGKPILDVRGLKLSTPFWNWFNTMEWVR